MKFTINTKKLDTPVRLAYYRILKHYGAGCYPGEPKERETNWQVPIEAFIPSKVVDEKRDKERILTFHFKDVGNILIEKTTMKIEQAPSLQSIKKNILEKKVAVRRIVEKDLIKILGSPELNIRFGVMKYAMFGLQPIYRTVISLLSEKHPTKSELANNAPHYIDQVNLLVNLGYAKYTEQEPFRLLPTNRLYELYQTTKETIPTAETVLGIVLANYYDYLLETMRIIHFVPYVRASASYYEDALKFGELISITEEHLRENIRMYYRGAPMSIHRRNFAYPTIIKELVDANVLEYDEDFITGRIEIFDRLKDVRSELPMNDSPYIF